MATENGSIVPPVVAGGENQDFDEKAFQGWLNDHEIEHRRYFTDIARAGVVTEHRPLFGKVDTNWFLDHERIHQSVEKALNIQGNPSLTGSGNPWETKAKFDDWTLIHNDRHNQIINVLNGGGGDTTG